MKTKFRIIPRKFNASIKNKIILKDFGKIYLNKNEMISFTDKKKRDYDVVKKSWGYYATPSINKRLKNNKFKTFIVKSKITKNYYILLVYNDKKKLFQNYIKSENLKIIPWPNSLKRF